MFGYFELGLYVFFFFKFQHLSTKNNLEPYIPYKEGVTTAVTLLSFLGGNEEEFVVSLALRSFVVLVKSSNQWSEQSLVLYRQARPYPAASGDLKSITKVQRRCLMNQFGWPVQARSLPFSLPHVQENV